MAKALRCMGWGHIYLINLENGMCVEYRKSRPELKHLVHYDASPSFVVYKEIPPKDGINIQDPSFDDFNMGLAELMEEYKKDYADYWREKSVISLVKKEI